MLAHGSGFPGRPDDQRHTRGQLKLGLLVPESFLTARKEVSVRRGKTWSRVPLLGRARLYCDSLTVL